MLFTQEYKDKDIWFKYAVTQNPFGSPDFFTHVHDHYEILYFISGSADFLVETTAYHLKPHSLVIVRNMESHKMNILSNEPYERFYIHFLPELLDLIDPGRHLLAPFEDRPLGQANIYSFDEFDLINPRDLFRAMAAPHFSEQEKKTTILLNLFPILGQISLAFSQRKSKGFSTPDSLVAEIVGYINTHLFEELSLDLISKKFFISNSKLSRQFKEATGSPIWDYIIHKRLVAAQNKIRNGKSAIAACQECGFKDYSSFYKAYIKRFGVSPKQNIED